MSAITLDAWEMGWQVAEVWYCDDDECACYQPRIEQVSPNREAGYPWIRRETLWEGTFVSTGVFGWPEDVTYASLEDELREALKSYPDARSARS